MSSNVTIVRSCGQIQERVRPRDLEDALGRVEGLHHGLRHALPQRLAQRRQQRQVRAIDCCRTCVYSNAV